MGLEVGRKVGGIILPLKVCGHVKRTAEKYVKKSKCGLPGNCYAVHNKCISSRRHGYNLKRTTYCACITNAMQCIGSHGHTHIPSARHVDLEVGRVTDRLAYLPTCLHKKPKSSAESLKNSTPGSEIKIIFFFKSFL